MKDLKSLTRQADVIVSAAGVPNLVTPDMVKSGVVLVDVGLSRSPTPSAKTPRLVGDIDPGCRAKASFYTPVPGGVGPVTVACLLKNTLLAAELQDR